MEADQVKRRIHDRLFNKMIELGKIEGDSQNALSVSTESLREKFLYGVLSHAKFIKKIPVINKLAEKIYIRLITK